MIGKTLIVSSSIRVNAICLSAHYYVDSADRALCLITDMLCFLEKAVFHNLSNNDFSVTASCL